VNVPVDFTKPVEVPPPDDVITGDASPFLGKWIARSPFAPCSVEACTHLEFKQGKGGAITGTLLVDAVQDIPHGPFPPVTDPNVGYPPGMDPNDYFSLRVNNTAGVPYTVFDGQVRNGKLDFWTSRAELWASWCALQTSYRWDVDGKERYRCVPQSATEADTEPGRFTLCTTPWDGAICKSDFGNQYPCACLDNGVESGRPECQFYSPICECSQKECQAGVRVSEAWSRLEVRGDTLVGQVSVDPSTTTMDKTFTRETP
jgi:hypothetical protein